MQSQPFRSQQKTYGIFNALFEGCQQLGRNSTINDAMVRRKCATHDDAYGQLSVTNNRALLGSTDRQDPRLRRIEDRGELPSAVHA